MQKTNIHGIISIVLLYIAFGLGIVEIGRYSLLLAAAYLLVIILFTVIISITYCTKCLCREACIHFVYGWISRKIVKNRVEDTYNNKDILLGVLLPMLAILVVPQFWLFKNLPLLIAFWVLIIIAGIEVILTVCPRCKNQKCVMCKLTKQNNQSGVILK